MTTLKMEGGKARRCTHCVGVSALVEWHCTHGSWCSRCFYEHLRPAAKVERMMREAAQRERLVVVA